MLSWGPPTGEVPTTMVFMTGRGLKESMAFGGMISIVNKSSGQVEGVIPVSQRRSTIPGWSQEAVVLSTDGSHSADGVLQVVLESMTMVVSVATCWVPLESHPGHGRSTTGSAGGLADPPTRVLQIELGSGSLRQLQVTLGMPRFSRAGSSDLFLSTGRIGATTGAQSIAVACNTLSHVAEADRGIQVSVVDAQLGKEDSLSSEGLLMEKESMVSRSGFAQR